MPDLREQLREILQDRVCLVGVGNVDLGDDGFGVRLAEIVKSELRIPNSERSPRSETRTGAWDGEISDVKPRNPFGCPASDFGFEAIVAGTTPERHLARLRDGSLDSVLFLDAIEFGAPAGSVVLLNSREMAARFPQISTHKISLGLLAQLIEADGRTKAWLLGVQRESLRAGGELSPPVKAAVDILSQLIGECPVPPTGVLADTPAHSTFRIPHSAFPC